MAEEPFSADRFQSLLSNLTTGSRDLIVELTAIAERSMENSEQIVELIEQRITRCLPRYKLFAFYLLDSVVKTIGTPYNLLFSNNLYKIFTETYLLVTDVQTRQHLIDLFTTWIKGQTASGTEIFNKDILKRIEQFIIKATSLNGGDGATMNPTAQLPSSISPDHFHRECNYLLQYIIQMAKEMDPYQESRFYSRHNKIRNDLVTKINEIDEMIFRDSRMQFNLKVQFYHANLVDIRSQLDRENYKQNIFILKQFKLDLKPNSKYMGYLRNPFESIEDDDNLYILVQDIGLKLTEAEAPSQFQGQLPGFPSSLPPLPEASGAQLENPLGLENPSESLTETLENPLGFGFSLDFDPDEKLEESEANPEEVERPVEAERPEAERPEAERPEAERPLDAKRPLEAPKKAKKRVKFDV